MNDKQEIYLTELEVDIMHVFVKRKILSDEACAAVLEKLASKLLS